MAMEQPTPDPGPAAVAANAVGRIHADLHGAIVIPYELAAKLPDACDLCARRETPILEIARSKDFSLEKLKEALRKSAEIH